MFLQPSDRSAKLRKLNDFRRRLPHCSASALGAVVEDIKKHGLPEGPSHRNYLRLARDQQCKEPTPFGPILQRVTVHAKEDDAELQLAVAHPIAHLWKTVAECKSFNVFFLEKLSQNPPTPEKPWNIVLYTDEVTPGNPLATLNKRRFQAIYWSFLEFGINALSHEEAWFCVCTEFSTLVNKMAAGMSQVVAAILKLFFPVDGTNLATSGMLLPFDGPGHIRLFARHGATLQDGGAHKSVFSSRGDGASKFCILCKNLFERESEIVDEDGTNLLCCDILEYKGLVPATSRDLRKSARYLEKKFIEMGPGGPFTELQQALGMTHHPHALLLDRALDDYFDPVHGYLHDWMHALFVDGVFNLTLYLLLETFIITGETGVYEVFSNYIATWRWPHRVGMHGSANHLAEIFSRDRRDKHRAAKHIKMQASDGLSLTGVSALFVVKVLMELEDKSRHKQCIAFLALVDVIDIIVVSSRVSMPPEKLLTAVEKFLHLFKEAWGIETMVPKFHWMLHFWKGLARFKHLLNCFCLERKHKVPKRYATDIANISKKASESLLMEVTSHHLHQIDEPDAFDFSIGLVRGSKGSRRTTSLLVHELELDADGAASIKCSKESRFNPMATCHKGDFVIFNDGDGIGAGFVELHCEVLGMPISMIAALDYHRKDSCGLSVWKPKLHNTHTFIETELILDTSVYSEHPNGNIRLLLPMDHR